MWSHWQTSRTLAAAGVITVLGVGGPPTNPQGSQEITIGGTEYAFLGVPKTTAPGPTSFSFDNRGKMPHMMIIARLRDGITPDSVLHTPAWAQGRLFGRSGSAFLYSFRR